MIRIWVALHFSNVPGGAGGWLDGILWNTLAVVNLRTVVDDVTLPGSCATHDCRPADFLEVPYDLLVESLRTVTRALSSRFAAFHQ